MGSFKAFDRVRETSVSTGTGDIVLAGAVTNFRAVGSLWSDTDTGWFTFIKGSDFETSFCRYNSGANSLTRLYVDNSSNADLAVSFSAGTMDVINTLPAKVAAGIGPVHTFDFRLTPSTGVAEVVTAVTGATSVFSTPSGKGSQRSRFDGNQWLMSAAVEDSLKLTDAQSGTTSTSSPNITGLPDTSKIPIGYKISGTGTPANAVVGAIVSPTSLTMYVSGTPTNGTSNATNTITFKAPANTMYDMYDDGTSATQKLQAVARAVLFTQPTFGTQDGVKMHPSLGSLRHLGWYKTSNTDGQLDYTLSGKYRFSIWNRYNSRIRNHIEGFNASGTYDRAPSLVRAIADVMAPGGGSGGAGLSGSSPGAATAGGTTSLGSLASANGGSQGSVGFANGSLGIFKGVAGADGTATATDGDAITGGGLPGAPSGAVVADTGVTAQGGFGGNGGRAIRPLDASLIGATETVTCGAPGAAGTAGGGGAGYAAQRAGIVRVYETLEI